ncbi:D-beta-hydroxybutyrate dehydrogenase, mitochondrial-like [Petromyzon marinus]|uniref:D-beta-hydroxybutyrate dehydrogenase, mitochondrial-like n=1 Tax=Petromyzon marinus TaxID=7757 RepID=UPI003F6FA32F
MTSTMGGRAQLMSLLALVLGLALLVNPGSLLRVGWGLLGSLLSLAGLVGALGTMLGLTVLYLQSWQEDTKRVDALHKKAVLVTGCDSGFGLQFARELHGLGMTVLAGCLQTKSPGASELAALNSPRMHVLALDVTSDENVEEVLRVAQGIVTDNGLELWCVVNNAGVGCMGEIEWTRMSSFRMVAEVNLWGAVRITKAFLPLLRRSRGRIVNMSSIAARTSSYNNCAYAITKVALESFSDALRLEMHKWGVQVSLIEPGNYTLHTNLVGDTSGADHFWNALPEPLQRDYGREYVAAFASQLRLNLESNSSTDASPVVSALRHAVTSRWPRRRYLPASRSERFAVALFSALPAVVADRLFTSPVRPGGQQRIIPDLLKQGGRGGGD